MNEHHDGILEEDNRLPNWWLATLFGAIVFAAGYWFYFHVFQLGEMPLQTHRREMAELLDRQGKSVPIDESSLVAMANDAQTVAEGATIFTQTCAPCHGPSGGGNAGPNLTDEYWLHGGTAEQIFKSVTDGYPLKGMPAWGPQLGARRIPAVTAYVLTLRNTHAPGGKPPQGEKQAAR